jgi:hypothetical protein
LAGSAALGCAKKVKVAFVNETQSMLQVTVDIPGRRTEYLGFVPGGGEELTETMKFDKDRLPLDCTWRAGSYTGVFDVTRDTGRVLVRIHEGSKRIDADDTP